MEKEFLAQCIELNLQFAKYADGLIPTVVQSYRNGRVLMVGFVNQAALEETLKSGYATFWNRKKQGLWKKGETSGDLLEVKEIRVDCDQDTLLYFVEEKGFGACHTKDARGITRSTCFYRRIRDQGLEFIEGME